ncbi:hypothetical protein ACHAXR_012783 [Thalassiosira sp. AJA248-18]
MESFSDSDSEDSIDDAYGTASGMLLPPPHAQQGAAVGYNSYGRPSMTSMNNNSSFQQQSSSGSEDDDGSDGSSSDGNDDEDDSDEEESAVAMAAPAPPPPRGKTFRPPVGDGDSSTSESEDEEGKLKPSSNGVAPTTLAATAAATTQAINPNPGPPRGKELRLIMKANDSSSDDDAPLSKKKTKRGSKAKAKNNGAGTTAKKAATKKGSAATTKKRATASKKRKAPPAATANDSDSDSDDDDACVATIVGGSDSEGVMAVAKKIKANDGTAKRKAPAKKTPAKKGGGAKKGSTKKSSSTTITSSSHTLYGMPEISAEKARAAQLARSALQEAVTRLPHKVTPQLTVRSFGRIKPEYYHNSSPLDAMYSSPHAICPVGFSCDRFEFSPVHGRVIKMRCDILDGSSLKKNDSSLKPDQSGSSSSEPMLVEEKIIMPGSDIDNLGDGPVFRVTWGEGVEEDKLLEPSCPFDPYVASAHLGGDVDAIAVPLSSSKNKGSKPAGLPEVGMRVSVRFDKGKDYGGLITKVKPMEKAQMTKNKKAICNITIKYDDGVTEVAPFPDPDIVVAYQGCPPVETANGLVTEMNGKPVQSVLAKSPLEAWGKTLLSLGLIDEIMYGAALQELQTAREEGFNEVRDKLDAVNKKRREDRAKEKLKQYNRNSIDGDDEKSQGAEVDSAPMDKAELDKDANHEDLSTEEVELRKKLAEMKHKLEAAKKRSKAASLSLATARIATISPFAANPFLARDDSTNVETAWLAAAIKKERAKMGNTGNKRKIVNPATMMDKNDTFFDPKIERLVEGLPGTEFAPSYVFHDNRSTSGGNQAWIHEAKIKHQKQQKKKQEKVQKSVKHAVAKAKVEQERVLKRKLKEEEAENKKRQKEEEEDKRKRDRVEKRLSQLNNQMDDRLFKESCMMREKNIMNFVRGLNKEFTRRRKAAELAVGNKVDRSLTASPSIDSTASILAPFAEMLPPISRPYDVDIVRIWDFLHSFSDAFSTSDTPSSLPSLDSLQDAMNSIKTNPCDNEKRSHAIKLFKGIAMDLCKVISPSLTKTLSSSVPNVETIGKNGTDGGPQEDADVSCLPVTEWSWREVARMAIIYDVLTDLGYSKQESANFVKGYRSGGHPNSKEAKRWKKIEESPVTMMYQRIEDQDDLSDELRSRTVRASLSTPCTPSSAPSDWRFFLHNVKSRSPNSLRFIKNNVTRALSALKKNSSEIKAAESYIADLEKCLSILERSAHGNNSAPELHKAKQIAVGVLDSTREKCPLNAVAHQHQIQLMTNQAQATQEPARQRMGFQKMYQMSKEQFKALEQYKEEYMAAALRLKEDLERKGRDEANDDDEDDDDEDEDAEGNEQGDKPEKESHASDSKEDPEGEAKATADPDADEDEDAEGNEHGDKPDKKSHSSESKEDLEREAKATADPVTNGDLTQQKKDNGSEQTSPEVVRIEKVEKPEAGTSSEKPCSVSAETDETQNADKDPEVATSSDKTGDTADKSDETEMAEKGSDVDDDSSDNPNESSAVVEIVNTTNHPTVSEKDEHLPTEPAEEFPDGWVVRRIPRLNPSDKRTDRNWYSPKLELKFRSKADALRFLGFLESAKGDESAAIMEFHGKKKTIKAANKAVIKVANKVPNKAASKVAADDGAKAEYDFCEDVPVAPELIRRCLAVIRTLCASNSADQFVYPVDPQLYPSYYEIVMNPTSLYDIGKLLQEAGKKFSSNHDDPEIEQVVATVGRKFRTIAQNTICVNSSNFLVNSAEEMLRIAERLFFDWVLAPSTDRPNLEHLDDDRCIDHHVSDVNSMVLLCDACEGKYNMARLKPALDRVPSGDWYCPRCVSGRSWLTADPRIGRQVQNGSFSGTVQSCKFLFTEDGKPSILYCIKAVNSGVLEYWGVDDVDEWILGNPVESLRCLQALAESPGYGFGRDSGIVGGALPLSINPLIGDKAAQAALSSGVFKDTVSACVSLANPPEDFSADEWITLLMLLVTKCAQSDDLAELSAKLENKEASRLSSDLMTFWRARAAKNIVPNLSDDDSDSSEEESLGAHPGAPSDIPSVVESKTKKEEPPTKKEEPPSDIVMKSSGEEASVQERPANMEISFQSSTDAADEASSANATNQSSKDLVMSEEDILRRKREASFLAKSRRERKREEALMGYYVGNRLKSTAASFEEDFLSTIVRSTLCNQEEGLDLSAVRCRETCHYCNLSDVALGAPLCRTPNEKEWRETFPHAVHDRTTYMIAEFPEQSSTVDSTNHENGVNPATEDLVVAEKPAKVVMVRVRVGGELVSSKTKCIDNAVKNFDSAMHQFLPRNPIGFQSELKFRYGSNLSILSGSNTAHEMCAIAAHRSLKEKLLSERRAFHRANMTREAALACGKSVPIGTDPFGRSYWVFSAEPTSLFVCQVTAPTRKEWHRFHKPEEIASVMVCLGKDTLCESLKEVFPEAAKIVKDRSWSTLLLGRSLTRDSDGAEALSPSKEDEGKAAEEQDDYGAPFVEDEDVLVESEKGKFLWDAVIVDVSKDPETDKVNGYLVHYKDWSSRFDQWVAPDRVVEPNKVNLEVQEEVLLDFNTANDASPPMLEEMFAFKFLDAKKRARSTPVSKTKLFESAFTRPSAPPDEKFLGLLKGATLLIEAALPRGSVGTSPNGSWNPQAAALWRNLVQDAQGPESLMKCVLLLEDAISPEWLHSQATQLYSAVPKQWRAASDATLPAIALRVSVLDRCLKYQQKKKKHLD